MVRVKDKKAKGDDAFASRKQKVGRKKLAPATATKAEVHARTLRVDVQRVVAAEQQRQKDLASKEATEPERDDVAAAEEDPSTLLPEKDQATVISEALVGIVHYRAVSRKSALQTAHRWLQHRDNDRGLVAPLRTLQLVEKSLSCLVDTDSDVRNAAADVLRFIGTKTFPARPDIAAPLAATLLRHFGIALTHAERDVRTKALQLMGDLLGDEEKWWLEGVSDAREATSFLAIVVNRNVALHDEVLNLLDSAVSVAKATKMYGPLSAVLRAALVAPTALSTKRHSGGGGGGGGGAAAVGSIPTALASHSRVIAFLDDLAGHCCTLYKELMELRQGLFGLRDKFSSAMGVAHCLGVLLRTVGAASTRRGVAIPLSRARVLLLRQSFIEAVPFSIVDLAARKSLNGLRLIMAIGAVAVPLLGAGMPSVAKPVMAACEALLGSDNTAVFHFAATGIASLLEAQSLPDQETRRLCFEAAARLTAAMPTAIVAVLQHATEATSRRCASQARDFLHLIRCAFDAGLFFPRDGDEDSVADAGPASSGSAAGLQKVPVGLVKALFMGRETSMTSDDCDAIVSAAIDLLTHMLTSRSVVLPSEARAGLRAALPSLFGLPGAEGAMLRGAAMRCSEETQLRAAAAVLFAGGALPSSGDAARWAVDPRLAAAAIVLQADGN